MRLPDMNAQALLAYEAWAQRQAREGTWELPAWTDLHGSEQDAWRRAVRLLAVLGEEA